MGLGRVGGGLSEIMMSCHPAPTLTCCIQLEVLDKSNVWQVRLSLAQLSIYALLSAVGSAEPSIPAQGIFPLMARELIGLVRPWKFLTSGTAYWCAGALGAPCDHTDMGPKTLPAECPGVCCSRAVSRRPGGLPVVSRSCSFQVMSGCLGGFFGVSLFGGIPVSWWCRRCDNNKWCPRVSPAVLWIFGALVLWIFGALVLWCFGALVLWCFGALVLWCFGGVP